MLSVLSICPVHSPTSATTPSSVMQRLAEQHQVGRDTQPSLLDRLIQHAHQPTQSGKLSATNAFDPGLGDCRGSPDRQAVLGRPIADSADTMRSASSVIAARTICTIAIRSFTPSVPARLQSRIPRQPSSVRNRLPACGSP